MNLLARLISVLRDFSRNVPDEVQGCSVCGASHTGGGACERCEDRLTII